MPERYDPKPGFWRPNRGRPSRWRQDTAETLLSVQDYVPPKDKTPSLESLGEPQSTRESAFQEEMRAHARGEGRTSSLYHRFGPGQRTVQSDIQKHCFELGWDSAAARAQREVANG